LLLHSFFLPGSKRFKYGAKFVPFNYLVQFNQLITIFLKFFKTILPIKKTELHHGVSCLLWFDYMLQSKPLYQVPIIFWISFYQFLEEPLKFKNKETNPKILGVFIFYLCYRWFFKMMDFRAQNK